MLLAAVPAGASAPPPSAPASPPPSSASAPVATDYTSVEFQVDLALGLLEPAEIEAYYRADALQTEAAIESCMAAAGFEYVPLDEATLGTLVSGEPERSEETISQWGFYVLTTLDPTLQPGVGEVEAVDAVDAVDAAEIVDPNAEIVAALSDDDRNVWYVQLGTCGDEQFAARVDPLSNPDVMAVIGSFLDVVGADPRVVAAEQGWAECMTAAGQPFATKEEMSIAVQDPALFERFAASSAWEPASPDHADWQAAVDREIAVALADHRCTPAFDEAYLAVVAERKPELVAAWESVGWDRPVGSLDAVPTTAP